MTAETIVAASDPTPAIRAATNVSTTNKTIPRTTISSLSASVFYLMLHREDVESDSTERVRAVDITRRSSATTPTPTAGVRRRNSLSRFHRSTPSMTRHASGRYLAQLPGPALGGRI